MATFSNLPAELLLCTMSSVDFTRDLHSLISASPECLHVFVSNRPRILKAVLEQGILPDALRAAIFAVQIPSFSRPELRVRTQPDFTYSDMFTHGYVPDTPLPDTPLLQAMRRRAVTAHVEKYLSKAEANFPIDTPTLVRLCRLQRQMLHFTDMYIHHRALRSICCTRRPSHLDHQWHYGDRKPIPQGVPGLSYADRIALFSHPDRAKMQKAFFHREISMHLFYVGPRNGYPMAVQVDFDEEERCELFEYRLGEGGFDALQRMIDYIDSLHIGEDVYTEELLWGNYY